MKLLKMLLEQISKVKLSNYQSYTLLLIYSSPTPELASSIINKSEKLINAVNFLKGTRLIRYNPSGYYCTDDGSRILIYDGFLDENKKLTEKGKKLLNARSDHLR